MSTESTLKERGERYGSFNTHAAISQKLKQAMQTNFTEDDLPWENLAPDMQEALEMIQHKIARILNGDPNYVDSWHDIQGYAKLIEDRLVAEQSVICVAPIVYKTKAELEELYPREPKLTSSAEVDLVGPELGPAPARSNVLDTTGSIFDDDIPF